MAVFQESCHQIQALLASYLDSAKDQQPNQRDSILQEVPPLAPTLLAAMNALTTPIVEKQSGSLDCDSDSDFFGSIIQAVSSKMAKDKTTQTGIQPPQIPFIKSVTGYLANELKQTTDRIAMKRKPDTSQILAIGNTEVEVHEAKKAKKNLAVSFCQLLPSSCHKSWPPVTRW